MTLQTIQNLTIPQELRVISDPATATRANGAPPGTPPIAPKTLAPVPELGGWPGPVEPGAMLHLLGEALTPELPYDEFEIASTWALYRYMWAFAPPSTVAPLRLSDAALRLVDHHRTLASEQLGIACGLHVALWIVAERHPGHAIDWVDADVALDPSHAAGAGLGLAAATGSRRMRPDYFLIAADPNADIDHVYGLECKGSHDGSLWRAQMKKGASQVGGVTIGGQSPPSYVTAVTLAGSAIDVRVLDPPGGERWSGRADFESGEDPVVRASPSGLVEIGSADRFRADLRRIADGRRLAFAGQYAEAAELLPERVRARRATDGPPGNAELEPYESPFFGEVLFNRARLPVGDRVLEVWRGLSLGEAEGLRERDPQRRRDRVHDRDRSDSRIGTSLGETALDEDGRGMQSLKDDGTFLRLRII